jgi:hypothetical protein
VYGVKPTPHHPPDSCSCQEAVRAALLLLHRSLQYSASMYRRMQYSASVYHGLRYSCVAVAPFASAADSWGQTPAAGL